MLLRTAKPCGPGTRCWCQVGGGASAQPGLDKPYSADDGDKRNSSPGRARNKPLKPLRVGMPGESGGPSVTMLVCLFSISHARLRVHWAPGIPHALWGESFMHSPGASRRWIAKLCLRLFGCSKIESEATST